MALITPVRAVGVPCEAPITKTGGGPNERRQGCRFLEERAFSIVPIDPIKQAELDVFYHLGRYAPRSRHLPGVVPTWRDGTRDTEPGILHLVFGGA